MADRGAQGAGHAGFAEVVTVGRAAEQARLVALVEATASGVGDVLLIEGVAGIGKSHLLDQVSAAAAHRGLACCRGAAAPLDQDRPFHAIFAALGCAADALDGRRRELWRLVAEATAYEPWEREGATARFAVIDRIVDLVEEDASHAPFVVALDDLHWADPASIQAFHALGRLSDRLALLVVGAYRPVPQRPELHEVVGRLSAEGARGARPPLRLGPLDAAAIAELADQHRRAPHRGGIGPGASAAGTGVDHVPLDALGGNPYLVVAALRATAEATAQISAQDAVRWALRSRLVGLGPATVENLRVAAALGGHFEVADLAVIRRRAELDIIAELGDALRAGVIVADGAALRFEHDLLRQTLLEDLAEPLRAGLDRVIWQQLADAGRPAAAVVTYVLRSAQVGDGAAVDALRRAAVELGEADPSTAADLLFRAAELAVPLGWALRATIANELAEMLRLANRLAEVVDVLEECLEWPLPVDAVARLEYTAALALRFLGRVPESTELLRRAIRREALPPATTSWAWSLVIGAEVFSLQGSGALEEAVIQARRAAEVAGDRAALVQAGCAASSVSWMFGRIDEALRLADAAMELSVTLGNAVWPAPALMRALALLAWGDPDTAIDTITPWGRRAERLGDLWALSRMEMVTTVVRFDCGQWDAVPAHCETIVRVGEETGGANGQPLAQAVLGLIALRRGDVAAAEAQRQEGHRVAASPCLDPIGLPFLAWLDAELADANGDRTTARAILDGTFDVTIDGAPVTGLWIAPLVCRWAMQAGDVDRARHVSARLSHLEGTPRGELVMAACAALSEADGARLMALAATDVAACYPHLRLELLSAAVEHLLGDDAATARAEAATLARSLGMEPPGDGGLGAGGAGASGVGGGAPKRKAATAARPTFGPASLTKAERNVLELVADGLTNAAIAERLFLSKRTVESHVSRMYVKLGLTTRVELARVQLVAE